MALFFFKKSNNFHRTKKTHMATKIKVYLLANLTESKAALNTKLQAAVKNRFNDTENVSYEVLWSKTLEKDGLPTHDFNEVNEDELVMLGCHEVYAVHGALDYKNAVKLRDSARNAHLPFEVL
jgi:hypothetical protein